MQKLFFFIVIAIISFNCSSSEAIVPHDLKTEKFTSYLKENFDDSIRSDAHLYFLIAAKDSRKNISTILSRLKHEMKNIPKQDYTVIFSVNVPVADSLVFSGNSRTDWNNAIEALGFNFSGVAVVQTKDNKIIDMLQLGTEGTGTEEKFLEWK